jgi:hypothetical protein
VGAAFSATLAASGDTAPKLRRPTGSGGELGSDAGSSGAGGGDLRPLQSRKAVPGQARTRKGTPRRGAA